MLSLRQLKNQIVSLNKAFKRRPPVGRLRRFLIQRSLLTLVCSWLVLYVSIAVAFGFGYHRFGSLKVDSPSSQATLGDAVHFSFTTQATVGYGDIAPLRATRLWAATQGCLGMILNALAFGLVTYRLIRHPVEVEFSNLVVYYPVEHVFWLRWTLLDDDDMQATQVDLEIIQSEQEGLYDRNSKQVAKEGAGRTNFTPSINLMALKSKSNHGNSEPQPAPSDNVVISPLDIHPGTQLIVSISGTMQLTGDSVFSGKAYPSQTVRCAAFVPFDNSIRSHDKRERYGQYKKIFNRIIRTQADACRRCPFHQDCPLDVAVETRSKDRVTGHVAEAGRAI